MFSFSLFAPEPIFEQPVHQGKLWQARRFSDLKREAIERPMSGRLRATVVLLSYGFRRSFWLESPCWHGLSNHEYLRMFDT